MTCKILIVGESYGENEAIMRSPFVGKAGFELYRMMCEAGFPFPPLGNYYPGSAKMKIMWGNLSPEIQLTDVFCERPPNNRIDDFLSKKPTAKQKREGHDLPPVCEDLPPLKPGLYLHEDKRHHLNTLDDLLLKLKPNLTLTCGNTACWAVLKQTKISALRGTIVASDYGKVLPTYHPAAVSRNYEFRPITITDLMKTKLEMDSPEFTRKRREIWVEPDIDDLYTWWEKYGKHSDLLSLDIETERATQISEIGFASDDSHALHIPFIVDRVKSYWPTLKKEIEAWKFVRMALASSVPKLGQNYMYDLQFLWVKAGIPTVRLAEDTMLLHHALYPGMQKSLGFLGSIYCNEPSWKLLRREGNKDDE